MSEAGPPNRTVWLIGAGFSASLGGPLLTQMFRREYQRDLEAYLPEVEYKKLAERIRKVQALYHVGKDEKLWADPEQFLAYADDALSANAGPKGKVLKSVLIRAVKDDFRFSAERGKLTYVQASSLAAKLMLAPLNEVIRKALALECSKFTWEADVASELWSPHVAWAERLDSAVDTVVGFNYDPVVEMADTAKRVHVVLPQEKPESGKVPYFKLHGSADWVLRDAGNGKRICVSAGSAQSAIKGEEEIAIASPGASKARFCQEHLESLWQRAQAAIAQAQTVNIIGYSAPATDPRSQGRVLEALATDVVAEKRVNIVMGDDIASPSAQRMLTLVCSAAAGRPLAINVEHQNPHQRSLTVRQHRLWAQDFLLRYSEHVRLALTSARRG
jgi:hypothetical protein